MTQQLEFALGPHVPEGYHLALCVDDWGCAGLITRGKLYAIKRLSLDHDWVHETNKPGVGFRFSFYRFRPWEK